MSESVLRIPAQQSLFNSNNNLVDIIIPGGTGVYDLSNSYVAILTRLTDIGPDATALIAGTGADDGVYDVRLKFKHHVGAQPSNYDDSATPIECLVQSCSMHSAVKGAIEDIRRSDILRGTLSVYKEDLDSRQAKALTTWAGAAKDQPWVHGQHVDLVGSGTIASREVTHEIRLKLSDLFDAGRFEAWDSSVYGDTRIHLELNLGQVVLKQAQANDAPCWGVAYQGRLQAGGGAANLAAFGYATGPQGLAVANNDAANTVSLQNLAMVCPYNSLEDVPWWVGQCVSITVENTGLQPCPMTKPVPETIAAGATGTAGRAIIREITYNDLTGIVTLGFGGPVVANGAAGAAQSGTLNVTVKGCSVDAMTIAANLSYEGIELVASMRSDMRMGSAPKEHQFSRFVFQGDTFSNTNGVQRTYQIPANCTAVVMAITNGEQGHSSFLGSAQVSDYRFSIDGEAVTNRAVDYAPDGLRATDFRDYWGSSLHYDLLQKTFLNMGPNARYQSMREGVWSQVIPVGRAGDQQGGAGFSNSNLNPRQSAFVIGTPIPMKSEPSQLLLELNGTFTNGAQINIYSYVMATV